MTAIRRRHAPCLNSPNAGSAGRQLQRRNRPNAPPVPGRWTGAAKASPAAPTSARVLYRPWAKRRAPAHAPIVSPPDVTHGTSRTSVPRALGRRTAARGEAVARPPCATSWEGQGQSSMTHVVRAGRTPSGSSSRPVGMPERQREGVGAEIVRRLLAECAPVRDVQLFCAVAGPRSTSHGASRPVPIRRPASTGRGPAAAP